MKAKIIFGIIIPALVILTLSILASSTQGFSAKTEFIDQITLTDVFHDSQLRNSVKVGEISLANDYFLAKRHTLNPLTACLVDKDHAKSILDAGTITYSEGDYDLNKDSLIYSSYNYNYNQPQSVEIPAHGAKKVAIFINPSYNYYENYSQLLEQYKEYEELVIVNQQKQDNYYGYGQGCYSLQEADLESGEHILLVLK